MTTTVEGARDSGWTPLALSIAFCELAGIVPGVLTAEDVATWYQTLDQPSFTPPDWVFGPVWTLLFGLMGISLYLVRRDGRGSDRRSALGAFTVQLGLNVAWTLIFFGRHAIFGGLLVIAGLWVAIVTTILAFARVNRRAALLLVPYLLWVSFASALNFEIWRLNG
ncbi:MAG: TspO/MBR family protein [Salinigranum sp.]